MLQVGPVGSALSIHSSNSEFIHNFSACTRKRGKSKKKPRKIVVSLALAGQFFDSLHIIGRGDQYQRIPGLDPIILRRVEIILLAG